MAGALQVDLAFVPAADFRPLAGSFRLIFGHAREHRHVPPPPAATLIGMGWLYALHARSALGRHKLWQAEYMISGVRDHALALACLRHGLAAVHGRGIDELPDEVTAPFEGSLVGQLEIGGLSRAFVAAVAGLQGEIERAAPEIAKGLEEPLKALTESAAEFSA